LHGSQRKDTRKKTRKGLGRENNGRLLSTNPSQFPQKKTNKKVDLYTKVSCKLHSHGRKKKCIKKQRRRVPFDRVTWPSGKRNQTHFPFPRRCTCKSWKHLSFLNSHSIPKPHIYIYIIYIWPPKTNKIIITFYPTKPQIINPFCGMQHTQQNHAYQPARVKRLN